MTLIDIQSPTVPKVPTDEEKKQTFLKNLNGYLEQEALRRKQFIEAIEHQIWDSGIQVAQGPDGQQIGFKVGLSPEEKIEALGPKAVELFSAGLADRAHLETFASGITFTDHPNKANYTYSIDSTTGQLKFEKK